MLLDLELMQLTHFQSRRSHKYQPVLLVFRYLLKDPSTPGIGIGKVHRVMQ